MSKNHAGFLNREVLRRIQKLRPAESQVLGLPETAFEKATAHLVTRTLKAKEVVLQENDWSSSVYFILSGWVKIRTINPDGKEVTLNILGKGSAGRHRLV